MYFFFRNKKQFLDLTGNLILSQNDRLVKARTTSAGPSKVLNAKFVLNCGDLNLRGKLKATILVLRFIWGKPQPLVTEDTNKREPIKKEPAPPTACAFCRAPIRDRKYRNVCNKCGDAEIPNNTETEGRMNCPVIDMHCEYFAYQCDSNGEIAISYCSHPKNKSGTEGNCINELCPKLARNNTDTGCGGNE